MKLFIISDIHGSALAFNKAVEAFNRENASLMVICGDYLNHGPRNPLPEGHDTKALAAALNSMKSKICGIRGNCDSEVDQMMLNFPVTEASCRIMLLGCGTKKEGAPSGCIFVHHGHLCTRQKAAELTEKDALIVSGHTHVPVLEYENERYFVNPGSISLPKENSFAAYATVETDETGAINGIYLKKLDGTIFSSMRF
ncbi:MAG: phosphodiesterase [Spirochaetaceae bacterium]|nr:phosphodiesterase [Spirochaetaceae bacterium]